MQRHFLAFHKGAKQRDNALLKRFFNFFGCFYSCLDFFTLAKFGTLAEFGTVAEYSNLARWPIVEPASQISGRWKEKQIKLTNAGENHVASTIRTMRHDTISARCDRSVARQSTSFLLCRWKLRNLTLQSLILPYKQVSRSLDFRLLSTFARLYNAAASPASRLCSAGSLAITRTRLKHEAGNVRFANCHACLRKCTEITITSTRNIFASIYSR